MKRRRFYNQYSPQHPRYLALDLVTIRLAYIPLETPAQGIHDIEDMDSKYINLQMGFTCSYKVI